MKEELKKHPIEMSVVIVYAIMKSILQVAIIALRASLVDAVVQLDWQLFLWMIGAQVLLKGLQSVVIYLKTLAEEKVVQKVNTELRIQIVESMKQASYSEVTQREVPEYVSWMSNDMERIAVEGIPMFVTIIESIVTIVLSVAVLWTYHWSIVAVMVVSVSAMVMIPKFLESKTKAALSSYSQLQSRFVANLQNLLEGYSIFYAYHQMKQFEKRVKEESVPLAEGTIRTARTFYGVSAIVGMLSMLFQALMMILTGYLIYNHSVTIGVLASVGTFAGTLFGQMSIITQNWIHWKSIQVYLDKFYSIKQHPFLDTNHNPVEKKLELRDVSIQVGQQTIVQPISFIIEKGKKYALLGESGSGKSTLLRFLAGQLPDYTGEVWVDDHLFTPEQIVQLRNATIYNAQKNHLFNGTIADNLSLWQGNIDEQILKDMGIGDFAQLSDVVFEQGLTISGGERQRIALARTLLYSDKILLFDESTANLDPASAKKIEQTILHNPNLTVVMVTHHFFEENRELFDEVIELPTKNIP